LVDEISSGFVRVYGAAVEYAVTVAVVMAVVVAVAVTATVL